MCPRCYVCRSSSARWHSTLVRDSPHSPFDNKVSQKARPKLPVTAPILTSFYLHQPFSTALTRTFAAMRNHRITGWKRPLRSSSPTIRPTPPCLLNRILKCHIYTFFEHPQGWGLHHCPGQPGPVPDHSFCKEIFPNIHSKSPLTHLRLFPLVLLPVSWEKRPTPASLQPPFR